MEAGCCPRLAFPQRACGEGRLPVPRHLLCASAPSTPPHCARSAWALLLAAVPTGPGPDQSLTAAPAGPRVGQEVGWGRHPVLGVHRPAPQDPGVSVSSRHSRCPRPSPPPGLSCFLFLLHRLPHSKQRQLLGLPGGSSLPDISHCPCLGLGPQAPRFIPAPGLAPGQRWVGRVCEERCCRQGGLSVQVSQRLLVLGLR